MKSINQVILVSIILSAGALTNCKKKKDEVLPAPSITFDSLAGSAKNQAFFNNGDRISLTYKAKSSDNLASISFSETVIPSSASVKATPSKTGDFTTATSHDAPYISSFPQDASLLTIKIDVADTKSKTSSTTFTARTVNVNRIIGGSTYSDGLSYYSSLDNKSYKDADFTANKDNIDISFGFLAPSGGTASNMLLSSDERTNLGAPKGTGGRKTYFKESAITGTDFATTSAATIYGLVQSDKQSVTIAEGKVYEFISPTIGSKGLIYVTKINPGTDPSSVSIVMSIKTIKYK